MPKKINAALAQGIGGKLDELISESGVSKSKEVRKLKLFKRHGTNGKGERYPVFRFQTVQELSEHLYGWKVAISDGTAYARDGHRGPLMATGRVWEEGEDEPDISAPRFSESSTNRESRDATGFPT